MRTATKLTKKTFQLLTGTKARKSRFAEPPKQYWLDVGKRISLEMTAAQHNFAVKGGDR